jgi:SAM-dependent methyltransferase
MSEAADELARAYAGVEELASLEDADALRDYRESVLARSRPQADFLLEHLPASASLLEVACGNGRLLIELADRGALSEGVGHDIAASRIEFARRWAEDAGHSALSFEAADVLESELGEERYDAAICITGAFGYFEPFEAGGALRLARKLHAALRPGGLLLLELYPSPRYRRLAEAAGGEVNLWTELPPEDPWRFYLSHLTLDGPVLVHEKTFIHRHTGEVDAGRAERLYLYSPRDIQELLEQAGFEGAEAREGWSARPYSDDESMVVIAWRPAS